MDCRRLRSGQTIGRPKYKVNINGRGEMMRKSARIRMETAMRWILLLGFSTCYVSQVSAQSDTIQTNVPALKNVYAHDFTIGCLLSYRNIGLPDDPPVPGQSPVVTPNGGYLIKFHMNCMSPGNNMKPQYTVDIAASAAAYSAATSSPDKDSIDTHPVVRFNGDLIAQLNWAQRQGFTFRGHTLVWHNQTPATFFLSGYTTGGARLSKQKMTDRMENYIKEIIRLVHGRWPGMLSAIDVVNEAVNDNGTFRTSGNDWYTTFGDSTYVMKAFQFARQYTVQYGEPQIKLYYNDYNTEFPAKADEIVRLCTPIYQAGYLDGIGMQEHNNNSTPTAQTFIASYNKFFPICSEMAVTELDVATGSGSPSAAVLATQADQYGMLFKCFVERSYRSGRGKIINVSKDGLNDAYTFQANQSSSLWDALNKCKPSFFAVADVGMNYNSLDSLIAHGDSLQQDDYTPSSWSVFAAALASGKNVRSQNFSNATSADTALGLARDALRNAIAGLQRNPSVVNGNSGEAPEVFALSQNYPNPFNPTTVIRYQIPVASDVKLAVYDVLGREVSVLVNEKKAPGSYEARFDGSGLSSGVYLYRLVAGSFALSRKLVLMK
jgi:GH35 family endo-1,4-beta-xylanase